MRYFLSLLMIVVLASCSSAEKKTLTREEVIQQIYDVEQAFNDMLAAEGRAAAFSYFADENGSINRNKTMITGKAAIRAFYEKSTSTSTLVWKPDFVDVSDDFTMAYTWGPYKSAGSRENGEAFENTGLFHTIWKRQADGSWRYVYD